MKMLPGKWSAVASCAVLLICAIVSWLSNPSLQAALFAAASAAFLAVASASLLRQAAARMRLAAPEVTVPSGPLRLGEEFAFSYRQACKRTTDVRRIRSQLLFRETVRYTTHTTTDDRTTTEKVTKTYEQIAQAFAVPGQRFEPGQTITEYRRFRIPDTGMHTFAAADNQIGWYVVVLVDIDRWADHRWEHELTVAPELLG